MNKIDRPEWFTLEKYTEYVKKGYNQQRIAGELFVSVFTLKRFLKEIDAPPRGLRPKHERPSWLTKANYLTMRKVGYSNEKIKGLCGGVTKVAFNRFLAEIGVKKK